MMEKFHYKYGKATVTLPKFDQLPFGVVRKLRNAEEEEQFFLLFELAADDKSLAVIDTMPMSEISDMVTAWQKEAGVEVGESSG